MSGADLFQAIASGVSIVDCGVRLAKFIKNLNDDAHDIREWLVEMKTSIDTLKSILDFVKVIAKGPNMKHADDGPIEWICTTVRICEDRAAKICEKLASAPGDGVFSKIEAVLRKLMNDRAIKEHESAIQRGTMLLQTLVITLSWERVAHLSRIYEEEVPAPPYGHQLDEFDRIRLKLGARLSDSLPPTRATSLYDPEEAASASTAAKMRVSILYKAKQQELERYQSRVAELGLERRYLEAATEQRNYIKLRRGLKKHMQLSDQEEALLIEKQANFLLQCPTIGRHCEAANLLENLINDKEHELTNEVNGRIKLKIGELYLAEGKLGQIEKVKRAKKYLNDAATLLEGLSPFPHELYPRSVQCLVRALETLQKPNDDARGLKSYVEGEYSKARLNCDINWEYTDEPESKALAWCRTQTSPAFVVESPDFKFDSTVQGTSAVHLAVRDGQIKVLREMLVEVEQIDALDSNECTPLLIAAQKRHSDIFKLLLDYEAGLNKTDKSGQTALHKCQTRSRDGRDIAIAQLIHDREPALLNAKESTGKTALWMACEESNEKMVEFLLSHGADPNIPSTKKKTPLQVAVDMRSSRATPERNADRLRIIGMLLKHDADSNQTDNLGNTPLHTAASKGDLPAVQLLLDPDSYYKTSVDMPGRHGQTPVAGATQNKHTPVMRELVSRGANVTSQGRDGKSAEDWAKGDPNKALRDALRPADSRRTSENSTGTMWKAASSTTSSGSVQTRESGTSRSLRRMFRSGD
ncbi:ankyrin repeat-containing domain protein [Xylaria cf. heliscus]|nr:ankyrin repeat-containing domain protein [Xylaria cf. heliscus]